MSQDPTPRAPGAPPPNPDLHTQAGEYVLGTLPAAERDILSARLPHDRALRAAVDGWETHLLPLTALTEPVAPSAGLWERIDRSVAMTQANAPLQALRDTLAAAPHRPARLPRWHWDSLALWRFLTAGALALSALLAVLLTMRITAPATPATPQFMVVLVAPQDKAPGWVIQTSLSRQLSLIPLGATPVPQDKALQFWTKAEGWNGPVSLGLVRPGQTVQIALDRLPSLQPNQLFELTLEPVTGSPTGKPTGPVQFIGRAVKVM